MNDLGGSILGLVFCLIYLSWAWYVGNKILTGRFAWLDRDAPVNKVCKFILAVNLGSLIAGFYLFWALWKWMARS